MSTRSLDSTTGISPLDALLAPPPRDNPADGTFAQHLMTPPAKTQPRPEEKPRQADDRSQQSEPDDSKPAVMTVPPVSQEQQGPVKVEASQDSTTGDTNDETPKPPVTETITSAAPVASEEEDAASPEDEEKPVVDELLLTSVAPPVQNTAEVVAVAPEAAEQTETAVAAIADDDTDTPKQKGAAPKNNKGAAEKAVVAAQAAVEEATDASATGVDSQIEVATATQPTAEELIAAANLQSSDAVAVTPAGNVPGATAVEKPAKSAGKLKSAQSDETEEPTEVEAETAAAAELVDEAKADGSKPRESKRDRLRSEGRNASAEKPGSSDPTPQQVRAAAAPGEAPAAAATSSNLPSEVAARTDISIPTPVAPPSTAPPTTSGAPQSLQRLPQQMLARPAAQGSRGAPPNPAEQARFVARVAKAFQTAQSRGGELQLRLSPAELGSLKLEIKLKDGVMAARVEAESVNAKNMLLDNLPVLKERLAEQGIVVEKFDVELMDRQPQGQPDTAQERERRQAPRSSYTSKQEDTIAATTAPAEARSLRSDGRLNVTV